MIVTNPDKLVAQHTPESPPPKKVERSVNYVFI